MLGPLGMEPVMALRKGFSKKELDTFAEATKKQKGSIYNKWTPFKKPPKMQFLGVNGATRKPNRQARGGG